MWTYHYNLLILWWCQPNCWQSVLRPLLSPDLDGSARKASGSMLIVFRWEMGRKLLPSWLFFGGGKTGGNVKKTASRLIVYRWEENSCQAKTCSTESSRLHAHPPISIKSVHHHTNRPKSMTSCFFRRKRRLKTKSFSLPGKWEFIQFPERKRDNMYADKRQQYKEQLVCISLQILR